MNANLSAPDTWLRTFPLSLPLFLSLSLSLGGCGTEAASDDGDNAIELSSALVVTPDDPVVAGHDDLTVAVPTAFNIPYSGMAAGEFPGGLPVSIGSGLRFRRSGLFFYGLTDRGPNVDAPSYLDAAGVSHPTKGFLVPDFSPRILTISVFPFVGPIVTSAVTLKSGGVPVDGHALAGATPEVGLTETLAALSPSTVGVDPEGIDIDAAGNLWLCDELGPSLMKVNPRTGEILSRLRPGSGLPSILASRQVNRGFEGVAVAPGGKVYALIQSTLDVAGATKGKAQFIRLVEYDPSNGATRMFAYPHDVAQYAKSGDAKLGDIVAIDGTRFLLIEQGKNKDKNPRNLVYAIDIAGATDLTGVTLAGGANAGKDLEYGTAAELAAQIVMVKKALVLDLRAYGWTDEKAEGLSLVDNRTVVVANDQDFGATSTMSGDATSTDPTAYVVDASGALTINGVASPGKLEVHATAPEAQRSHLFVVRLRQPVSAYAPL